MFLGFMDGTWNLSVIGSRGCQPDSAVCEACRWRRELLINTFFSVETDTTDVTLGFFMQNICVLNTSALPRMCSYLSLAILDFSVYSSALDRHMLLQCYSLSITGASAAVQILI